MAPTSAYSRCLRVLGWLALATVLGSCSSRRLQAPAPTAARANGREYVDLQPLWRLQVVTPIRDADRLRITGVQSDPSRREIVAAVDESFAYEIAFYAIEPRRGDGVRIRFRSAQLVRDGKPSAMARSTLRIFDELPRHIRFIRLLFLTRASQADHDMALLASDKQESLDLLTRSIKLEGAAGCRVHLRSHCSWIPAGVAVRPELQREPGGAWFAAR